MELYERIKVLSDNVAKSQTNLASMLNMPVSTLNGYLNAKRQNNLWPLLPRILDFLPQVSRDWLYFGEGDMFTSAARSASADDAKDVELELLRENRELLKENRELRSELDRLRQQQIETANTGELPVRSGKTAHTSPDGMSSK